LPAAKIVVGNIPDVRSIPFFNTIGPKVAASLPAGIYLRYQKHGVTGPSFDSTRFTEATPPLICLTGSTYASLLGRVGGQGAGQWYKDKGYPALPAGIDTTLPFGFHPQNPWPDALTLDASEQTTAGAAVTAFNSTIASVAASKNAAVVDMNAIFTNIKANGYFVGGAKFTADFISGGMFSLDGVHPSSKGSGIVANEFIRVINKTWQMSIPFVDVSALPALIAPVGKPVSSEGIPVIPYRAFKSFNMLWGSEL
jgi:hypothetical protein